MTTAYTSMHTTEVFYKVTKQTLKQNYANINPTYLSSFLGHSVDAKYAVSVDIFESAVYLTVHSVVMIQWHLLNRRSQYSRSLTEMEK